MTQEISEKDRSFEILNFFINNGFEALKLLSVEGIEKFNITPAEFFGIMLSLLESYIKTFSTVSDKTEFKKVFDDENRQKLVNFFDEALLEFCKKKTNFLDNHDEKELILDETKRDLKRIIDVLTCVYQLTEPQAISLLQDLLYASDELRNEKI